MKKLMIMIVVIISAFVAIGNTAKAKFPNIPVSDFAKELMACENREIFCEDLDKWLNACKKAVLTNNDKNFQQEVKIIHIETQIALNEKKIAENAEIERKTNYKGTTAFSTRDRTNQNIKLKKQLIEERAKLRRMK